MPNVQVYVSYALQFLLVPCSNRRATGGPPEGHRTHQWIAGGLVIDFGGEERRKKIQPRFGRIMYNYSWLVVWNMFFSIYWK